MTLLIPNGLLLTKTEKKAVKIPKGKLLVVGAIEMTPTMRDSGACLTETAF